MKYQSIMNKKIILLIIAFLFFILTFFSGCENDFFKPSAQLIIKSSEAAALAPVVDNNSISFPEITLTISLILGVSVNIDTCYIDFFNNNQNIGNNYKIIHRLSKLVKKDEDVEVTVTLYNEQIYNYMLDNQTPLTAFITISGIDSNSNRVECKTSVYIPLPSISLYVSFDQNGVLIPTDTIDDSGEVTVSFPQTDIFLKLLEGAMVNITDYNITYFYTSEITSLTQSGKISMQIAKGEDMVLTLPIYTKDVYDYAHNGSNVYDVSNDYRLITAEIKISGFDIITNKPVIGVGYITIDTTPASVYNSSG